MPLVRGTPSLRAGWHAVLVLLTFRISSGIQKLQSLGLNGTFLSQSIQIKYLVHNEFMQVSSGMSSIRLLESARLIHRRWNGRSRFVSRICCDGCIRLYWDGWLTKSSLVFSQFRSFPGGNQRRHLSETGRNDAMLTLGETLRLSMSGRRS